MKNYSIQKIITPTDFPFAANAVTAWSEKLSGKFNARLLLYSAVEAGSKPGMALYGDENNQLLKSAMSQLLRLGSSLNKAHSVKYLLESGDHWRNLLKQTTDEQTDLLVAAMPPEGQRLSGKLAAVLYNSPCPVLFVREGMRPQMPKKILTPVRLKDRLEQKLPAVAAWARANQALVCLSAYVDDAATAREKVRLYHLLEKMAGALQKVGVRVETESVQGFHFGTTMLQRARRLEADMIAIAVEPSNFLARMFTRMVGPYFLENATVPVLAVPLPLTAVEPATLAPRDTGVNPARIAAPGSVRIA